jgi:hypothetical protein
LDEAWIIFKSDAPQIPQSLKNNLPVPCVLTGNAEQARRTLNLLRAISLDEADLQNDC